MVDPVIVPRAEHPISRRDIDPDALRVLYRLNQNRHQAYLVGGGVRDLLLGRRPKDFDIGTSAHPYEIKKLFRNCWIIGRRFRLAHIKFGQKTIEVATFRQNVPEPPQEAQTLDPAAPAMVAAAAQPEEPQIVASSPADPGLIHRDNTFGTAEEDAFRRDFTINALFYDIATHTVIDYVGGLEDLRLRMIRSIGDPAVRFTEDPVRMFRAAVFAARLDFELDQLVLDAIESHRELIATASAARLLEEYFKVLRSGYAEASFRALHGLGLLELITPELESPPDEFWESLRRLDEWRRRFQTVPAEMTNAVLMGALLIPTGMLNRRATAPATGNPRDIDRVSFGMLTVARKDVERLRHVQMMLPKLVDPNLPPRMVRGIPGRPSFPDALTWLEIFDNVPDVVEHWKLARHQRAQLAAETPPGPNSARPVDGAPPALRRRRRRRRHAKRRVEPTE